MHERHHSSGFDRPHDGRDRRFGRERRSMEAERGPYPGEYRAASNATGGYYGGQRRYGSDWGGPDWRGGGTQHYYVRHSRLYWEEPIHDDSYAEDDEPHDDRYSAQAAAGWEHHPWNPERPNARRGLLSRLFGIGPKGYKRSDERIHEDICERLIDSDHVDCGDVSVEVKDGTVTLEGTVPDRYMKYEIEDIADSCSGVRDVENNIRVQRQSMREIFGYGLPESQSPSGTGGTGRSSLPDTRDR